MENKICSNCKYSKILESDEYECTSDYMIVEFNTYPQFPLVVEGDFGCIKWKPMVDK